MGSADIRARLLAGLARHCKFGRTRTSPVENVLHNVPQHLRGYAKTVLDDLLRDGLVAMKPSGSRWHVYLTPAGRCKVSGHRQ